MQLQLWHVYYNWSRTSLCIVTYWLIYEKLLAWIKHISNIWCICILNKHVSYSCSCIVIFLNKMWMFNFTFIRLSHLIALCLQYKFTLLRCHCLRYENNQSNTSSNDTLLICHWRRHHSNKTTPQTTTLCKDVGVGHLQTIVYNHYNVIGRW